MTAMKAVATRYDGTRPVSIAPTGAIGTGGLVECDVVGYNYMDPGAEEFHKAHPDRPVIGTETVSAVGTRGIYITDASKGYVSSYDPYTTTGRASAEGWWSFCDARPWLLGGFVEDRMMSAIFVSDIGRSPLYLYGGFIDRSEQFFPNHVLQEEIILRCLRAGKKEYDMGSLTPYQETDPQGVDQFKFGFGVVVTRHDDNITWYNKPLAARLVLGLKKLAFAKKPIQILRRILLR